MTRLENYLEKNCVSVSCAKGTQSKYYRIGAAIIRYSDHVSVDYSGFDIQIIKPVGSFLVYICLVFLLVADLV